METYQKYHNSPLIACAIMIFLKLENSIDITRLSLLLPLVLDKSLSNRILNGQDSSMIGMVNKNQRLIANYNKRYYSLLPSFAISLSMLLDMGVIELEGGLVKDYSRDAFNDMMNTEEFTKLNEISSVAKKIIELSANDKTRKLFNLLNVEL